MAVIGPIIVSLGFYFMVAGFCWTVYAIWNCDTGIFAKRLRRIREEKPNSIGDDFANSLVKLIVSEQDNWITKTEQDGYRLAEYIERLDGRVLVSNFGGPPQQIKITVSGVGEFRGGDLKPSIAANLQDCCKGFKQHRAVMALLKPETLTIK